VRTQNNNKKRAMKQYWIKHQYCGAPNNQPDLG